uniref:Serpentine receptor class gamma n=1 Tax=Caenorhabditis japonica TaxID=281687 RepID=A0A8R1ISH4_CAEJA
MFLPLLVFYILIAQMTSSNPMYWDFEEVPYNQTTMFTLLSTYWNLGKAPIFFPSSNASANYTSDNWIDPCYERFYEVGATF